MKNPILVFLLCFSVFIGTAALCADTDEVATQLFIEAKRLQETNGDQEKCLELFRTVVKEHPDYELIPWAKMRIGRALHDTGKYEESIAACDEVITTNRGKDVALCAQYYKMKALFRLKRYADAASLAWELDQNKSTEPSGIVNLERSQAGKWFNQLVADGSYDSALTAFNISKDDTVKTTWIDTIQDHVKANQDTQRTFREAKRLQATKGDLDKCLALFRLVINEHPDSSLVPWARMRIGRIYHDTQKYEEAINACNGVIADYPGKDVARWAQYFKMKSLFRLGRYADAASVAWDLDLTETYTDDGPVDGERFQVGRWFRQLETKNGFDSALATFNIRFDDSNKMVWIYMTRAYERADNNDFDTAENYFNDLCKNYFNAAERVAEANMKIVISMLGYYSNQKGPGNCDRLLYFLSIPKKLWPDNKQAVAESELRLAQYYINIKKDNASAQSVLEAALDDLPEDAPAYISAEMAFYLGQSLTGQGKYDKAVELYTALSNDNRTGWSHAAPYMKANALLQSGDIDTAKSVLEDATDPDETDHQWQSAARDKLIQLHIKLGNKDKATNMLREDLANVQEERTEFQDDAPLVDTLDKKISLINSQLQELGAEGGSQK